jgi:acylglycerol lipase
MENKETIVEISENLENLENRCTEPNVDLNQVPSVNHLIKCDAKLENNPREEQINTHKTNNLSNSKETSSLSSKETSSYKISFKDLRKFLNDDENVLGKVEKLGVRFTRKFVPNILNQSIRLYYTNIKTMDLENIKIIASLCFVHGFGHYSQEFYETAFTLAKAGINCHLIDLRGHGYSGGCRLDWTIEDLHTDILTLIKQAESDGVDLPLYVFGHSMGGGLVASLFINNQYLQVNGVILSAPLLGYPLNVDYDSFKFFILSKTGNNLREFVMNGNINPTELCKDERELIRIINDKKILPMASPRSFRSIMKMCERILENAR